MLALRLEEKHIRLIFLSLSLSLRSSTMMNKYGSVDCKVEITTQWSLGQRQQQQQHSTLGSLLLLCLLASSSHLFGQIALVSLTLSALPVH